VIDPTTIGAFGRAVVAGIGSWIASASRTRRALSADTVAVAHDNADKGIISRLQAREKYLADELDEARDRILQLVEGKVAAADLAGKTAAALAAALAAMEAERDLWRSAAKRLAKKVDAPTAADIMPSELAPFDSTQDARR
jgi:hypothetical protein